jgi:type IV secretion system protein VirD4
MTPDEVLRLKPPQKQSDTASEKIVAPGQMLIFVSGHYPILGTQMLYFLDPELARRAAIEPPKSFIALEDGHAKPQPAADRTRNLISKPETPPVDAEEPARAVESTFSGELRLGRRGA